MSLWSSRNAPIPNLTARTPMRLHLRLLARQESGGERAHPQTGENRSGGPDRARCGFAGTSRTRRLGDRLMVEAIAQCERLYPESPIKLSAQSHLSALLRLVRFRIRVGGISRGRYPPCRHAAPSRCDIRSKRPCGKRHKPFYLAALPGSSAFGIWAWPSCRALPMLSLPMRSFVVYLVLSNDQESRN